MILTVIAALLVYPVWVLIHEGSHALTAKYYGATIVTFQPWPNTSLGRFTWGSVSWTGLLSRNEHGRVGIAPRVPAFVATLLLPLFAYYKLPDELLILLAGGLIDQIVNSLGISTNSDMQDWCRSFGHNPWFWRAIGIMTALMFGSAALQARFLA